MKSGILRQASEIGLLVGSKIEGKDAGRRNFDDVRTDRKGRKYEDSSTVCGAIKPLAHALRDQRNGRSPNHGTGVITDNTPDHSRHHHALRCAGSTATKVRNNMMRAQIA